MEEIKNTLKRIEFALLVKTMACFVNNSSKLLLFYFLHFTVEMFKH